MEQFFVRCYPFMHSAVFKLNFSECTWQCCLSVGCSNVIQSA